MKSLDWDQTDFVECLEVLPERDESGPGIFFKVIRNNLFLQVIVWEDESFVSLSLFRDGNEEPIVDIHIAVFDKVVLRKEAWGEFLELRETFVLPSNYYPDINDIEAKTKIRYPVRVSVNPDIKIDIGRE